MIQARQTDPSINTPVMRVDRLSVHTQDGTTLVEPISLTLNDGQALIILGETGSGKSLLAQAIMGALPSTLSTQGQIYYHDKALTPAQTATLWGHTLAMLAQEPTLSLDPTMTVFEQVCEGFYYVAKLDEAYAKTLANDSLAQLGLTQFKQYYPHQLSGGMAQRSAFAAASAGGASIIIADEPTKGLDDHNRQVVVDLLKDIVNDGGVLLVITHDIEVAKSLATTDHARLMVMKKGQLLEQGRADDILTNPSSDYAKALIESAPSQWIKFNKPRPFITQAKEQNPPLVSLKNIAISRDGRRLFSHLNLDILHGDIVGISGASGIGKSSLGDALCGLIEPSEGQITWHAPPARHQLLKLYQDPPSAFVTHLSLQTLLDDVITRHHLDRDAVPPLLDALQLSPTLLERRADGVSGGELQRFAILRALLLKPVLLFADECTSRLDPITQERTMDLLIEQCQKNHCTLVMVSHDTELTRHYSRTTVDLTDYTNINP